MTLHVINHRDGFEAGLTEITRYDETEDNTGIGLAVLKLKAGENQEITTDVETAWLLMEGSLTVNLGSDDVELNRKSLFDESAT